MTQMLLLEEKSKMLFMMLGAVAIGLLTVRNFMAMKKMLEMVYVCVGP